MQDRKPIAYISTSLTAYEQNYVLPELECLATGTKHFDQYIFGHPNTTIHTDHWPLVSIFRKSIFNVSRCLQAMLLQFQRYPTIKVTWRIRVEKVIADPLSRDAYFDKPEHVPAREHLLIIRSFEDKLLAKIKSATAEDLKFRGLSDLIRSGWTNSTYQQPGCTYTSRMN